MTTEVTITPGPPITVPSPREPLDAGMEDVRGAESVGSGVVDDDVVSSFSVVVGSGRMSVLLGEVMPESSEVVSGGDLVDVVDVSSVWMDTD